MNRKAQAMKNKILQLIKDNINRAEPSVVVVGADTAEPTMYLYDVIDYYWGIAPDDFNKELMGLKGKTVHLRINSPGGDVFAAEAMATMIKEHGNVIAHIDGYAASAATRIASACNKIIMAEQGFYMIHESWTLAIGNKKELNKTAALLEKIDASIVADYERVTGQSKEQIVAWIEAETWFNAEEAKQYGFVDEIYSGESANDSGKSKQWNLAAFENAPAALKEPPKDENADLIAQSKLHVAANARRLQLLEIT